MNDYLVATTVNVLITRENILPFLLILLFAASCGSDYYYKKGLAHARQPTGASVHDGLTQVTPGNKKLQWTTINGQQYVLVVTWKADTTYYTQKKNYNSGDGLYSYNTGSYPIFVTAAPYLKEEVNKGLKGDKLNARLNEMLGLPPVAKYSWFLEVWVKPEDMFRPCFDPATNTSVCEYAPSKADQQRADHMNWLYQYIYNSYQDTDQMKQYPFTHLGYTYDWSRKNKSHVGLSEFVIGANKDIYIRKVYSTERYFE